MDDPAAKMACHLGTADQSAPTKLRTRSGITTMRLRKKLATNASWTSIPSGVFIVLSVSMAPRIASHMLEVSDATNQLTKYTKELLRMATGQKTGSLNHSLTRYQVFARFQARGASQLLKCTVWLFMRLHSVDLRGLKQNSVESRRRRLYINAG